MKRQWSEISGLPVLSEENDSVLGRLNAVFIHPETGQVLAYLVGWLKALVPVDIVRWTKDALWVSDQEVLASPLEILRIENFGLRRCFFSNKKVLSKSGKKLGQLRDFTLDTATDRLLGIESAKGFLWFRWEWRIFSAGDILEITDSSIVLNLEPEEKQKKTVKAKERAVATAAG